MKNIRIGNDIWFKWQILREEGVETWDGKDIKVTLRDSYGRECAVDWRKDEGGVISGVCRGRAQKRLGLYTLTLTENDGKDNMGCVDSVDAWRLVARQNASIVDEEERDGALGVEVVMLTSKVGIGTGEGITIDTELNEQSNNAIANSAVTKGINAVGEISEQDLQEVVGVSAGTGGDVPSIKPKKRKEQIIIGKAIKPKACDIGNVDNWYVFKDCVLVNMTSCGSWDESTGEVPNLRLHINDDVYDYINDSLFLKEESHVYVLDGAISGVNKFKVRSYMFDADTNTFDLYLEQKPAPDTIKGTSLTREYVNGNGIVNKECNIENALYKFNSRINDSFSNPKKEKLIIGSLFGYDIEYRMACQRNKKWRKYAYDKKHPPMGEGSVNIPVYFTRFKKKNGGRFHAGLYRIRRHVGHKKTRWVYVYLKIKHAGFRGDAIGITYTKK